MSIVVEKGAIRSQIRGIENWPIIYSFYEVIDDRKHSKSNQVFIDINIHDRCSTVGYSEMATKSDIDNTVKWFNTNEGQRDVTNIASKGVGLRFWEFRLLGLWSHVTYSPDKKIYYISESNTSDIWDAEINDDISHTQFSEILHRSTTFAKETEEVVRSIEDIFNNTENKYPFQPKTVFRCSKLKNKDFLREFEEDGSEGCYNFDDFIKKLKTKYYKEINDGLELYIKLPGYINFKKIENDNIDVIGFRHNCYDKLKIDFFIKPDVYYGYIFKIEEKAYEFRKNGNSVIRQKYLDISNLKNPDFTLFQYVTSDMTKEEKKNSIVGKSEEDYSGLYIEIGGTFINDKPVEWSIVKRNLSGNKNYRGVLQCLSPQSKHHLKLQPLKAQYNLSVMTDLHKVIKSLTDVYKAYKNSGMPDDSDKYVIINPSAYKTSSPTKSIQGYFYIIELAKDFFKIGQSTTQQRVFDYNKDAEKQKNKKDFPDIEFYDNPYCRYLSLEKVKNVKCLELTIKKCINESIDCQTYDEKIGEDIREYFLCNNFEKLYDEIINEINDHINEINKQTNEINEQTNEINEHDEIGF